MLLIPALNVMVHHGRTIREITGENAEKYILTDEALESGYYPESGLYLIREHERWVAIDNTDHRAYVEEFDELKDAKRWLIS